MFENIAFVLYVVWLSLITISVCILLKFCGAIAKDLTTLRERSYRDSIYGLITALFIKVQYTKDEQEHKELLQRIEKLHKEARESLNKEK